ncbi:amidohydrolase [Sinirhodobacter populi]|uniref:Amidohydrolase n=1 Tax=Paenirhodobacter populi TaxID=2306993 RepID=A0A443KNU0_9RHOB|nr:M20 aminoacylase family protein [Sinirhodobacter populi]RWR15405.1 amidohydrolase [Sinirhodobacter populi]RWR29122.1 amidohydrolase [Sinirhodobacter populi]RWR34540.1 amidohydrolase [Sinirhodobacter populi]
MPVKNRFAELLPDITAWRHDFHEHPELLYEVHRTAGTVARLLREFGCDEVVEGIGRTGVVGVIRGRQTGSGRVIGLRADMDALPILEATGRDYASKTAGVMHACGHDGHTSMLLGAARYLAETRNFDGTVVVMFQPAEEGGRGARAMVQDGVLDRFGVQEVYGLHNMPGYPVGGFAIRAGSLMASADKFDIVVTGHGGHAGRPHLTVDPVLIASQIVVGLQTIVARNVDPLAQAVVSVTSFRTDSDAHNVIPGTVRLRGTVRALDTEVQDMIERRIGEVAASIAAAHGGQAEFLYDRGCPVTVNETGATAHAVAVARGISATVAEDIAPIMAAEDFSFMLNERPGAYIFLGNGESAPLHHAGYDFDDEAIPFGCSWLAGMAEARMPAG